MRFVIDTNVFIASLSSTSIHHWLIEALLDERFSLCINNDILLEYEEVLNRKYSPSVASNFLKSLNELPNVYKIETYYQWHLLADEDDNKFVDVAVAGGATIVSEDKHFRIINNIEFPKLELMRINDFKQWLATH